MTLEQQTFVQRFEEAFPLASGRFPFSEPVDIATRLTETQDDGNGATRDTFEQYDQTVSIRLKQKIGTVVYGGWANPTL